MLNLCNLVAHSALDEKMMDERMIQSRLPKADEGMLSNPSRSLVPESGQDNDRNLM